MSIAPACRSAIKSGASKWRGYGNTLADKPASQIKKPIGIVKFAIRRIAFAGLSRATPLQGFAKADPDELFVLVIINRKFHKYIIAYFTGKAKEK